MANPNNILKSFTTSDQNLINILTELQNAIDSYNTLLSTAGLAIKAGGGKVAKAGTLAKAFIDGKLVSIEDDTDMPALAGTVANGKFNVFVFSMDSAGAFTAQMGTAGDTLGEVVFPTVPDDNAVIGFIIVNPTGTGDFVGGTSALDDATIVPNVVYVDTPYPFNPNLAVL